MSTIKDTAVSDRGVNLALLQNAFRLMLEARRMAVTYEANRAICKYVHSTSSGHEAIQLATGLQLQPCDYVSPYYRDDAMLLAMGFSPQELMLQLLAKDGDPFSAGRSYYSHPNIKRPDMPHIPHQSSATGMQVIPATGMAQGLQYLEQAGLLQQQGGAAPIVLCSLGDGSVTEGEVSEAWQFAVLRQLPILYLVQDNDWGISVSSEEARAMDAYDYAAGFKGMARMRIDGTDFIKSYTAMEEAIHYVRSTRQPMVVHAQVALLGHHTSGVRKEWYRPAEDLEKHQGMDPLPILEQELRQAGVTADYLHTAAEDAKAYINQEFAAAVAAPDPDPQTVTEHVFAPTPVIAETGQRSPAGAAKVVMVDAALHAVEELMQEFPECILYGQDVGRRLGGVFREAATLGDKFGDERVYNTAIQEAYIIGSTAGLCATGVKPIVEVQFGDYIFPGLNQLATEIAKSCYLTAGKYPVQTLLRVPVGAYGGGGPYHSGCVESTLLSIKGIKVVYPSNAADMKGLLKAAFLDPNPVVMLEHKGLYWSKVPGTQDAMTGEPSADYVIPLGKGRVVTDATDQAVAHGESMCVITYGMGVYWAQAAAATWPGQVTIVDLRTLFPLDEALIYATVRRHGKCLVLTEEQLSNSFAQSLAGRIQQACFRELDAPVQTLGALDLPAVPLNMGLEAMMLPNATKVAAAMKELLAW